MGSHSYSFQRIILIVLYLAGFLVLAAVVAGYHDYYALPLIERPHSPDHMRLKPGGTLGHGLGVVGSAMILLLFLYIARKREIVRWGSLRLWLNVHILFGILGPLFVTLHTAFKFGGIVSISYFSMVAVMASGVFGRYLYVQIPRAIGGGELSERQLSSHLTELESNLETEFGLTPSRVTALDRALGEPPGEETSALRILVSLLLHDLTRPVRVLVLKRAARRMMPDLAPGDRDRLTRMIRERRRLRRKAGFLETTRRIFFYWHVVHRPFAYVMIAIMVIHVAVVTYLGYRWIF